MNSPLKGVCTFARNTFLTFTYNVVDPEAGLHCRISNCKYMAVSWSVFPDNCQRGTHIFFCGHIAILRSRNVALPRLTFELKMWHPLRCEKVELGLEVPIVNTQLQWTVDPKRRIRSKPLWYAFDFHCVRSAISRNLYPMSFSCT